jgi:phage gp16-like protein
MLAKVHLAAKELRLDDDARRDFMEREVGKRSAAECSDAELSQILDAMKRQGFKPRPATAGAAKPAASPMAAKARALWISLHQLGVIEDPRESALNAFGARQLKVDHLQWADQGQAFRLIEALKAMAQRAGWDQDVSEDAVRAVLGPIHSAGLDAPARALKVRLVRCLWTQAQELGVVKSFGGARPSETGLGDYVQRRGHTGGGPNLFGWSAAELDKAVAFLARLVVAKRAEIHRG